MASFDKIFSRFLTLVNDYKLAQLPEVDLDELEIEWLYAASSDPRIRQKFSYFEIDNTMREVVCELRNSVDEYADEEFVVRILSMGMAIAWLQPQVDSILYTSPFIGGKEEKKILDTHAQTIDRLDAMKTELKKTLRDYGYYYNTYVNGGA